MLEAVESSRLHAFIVLCSLTGGGPTQRRRPLREDEDLDARDGRGNPVCIPHVSRAVSHAFVIIVGVMTDNNT